MARRSAPSAQPAYLPHPSKSSRTLEDPNESAFSRFLRTQVLAPEKLPGNLNVATAIALFAGGIAAVRTWGELMIPDEKLKCQMWFAVDVTRADVAVA